MYCLLLFLFFLEKHSINILLSPLSIFFFAPKKNRSLLSSKCVCAFFSTEKVYGFLDFFFKNEKFFFPKFSSFDYWFFFLLQNVRENEEKYNICFFLSKWINLEQQHSSFHIFDGFLLNKFLKESWKKNKNNNKNHQVCFDYLRILIVLIFFRWFIIIIIIIIMKTNRQIDNL